ncbi:hypothetical protein HYC85_026221 [Camellia sinensis]|uniref:Uncharacterized protein n=1 Tax=Camellia sinensis TaxID=4442 RepID=A0A7J7G324_CAMSI|nr:hypothetical protein HYC85_026221 [Camellia sinensis]
MNGARWQALDETLRPIISSMLLLRVCFGLQNLKAGPVYQACGHVKGRVNKKRTISD